MTINDIENRIFNAGYERVQNGYSIYNAREGMTLDLTVSGLFNRMSLCVFTSLRGYQNDSQLFSNELNETALGIIETIASMFKEDPQHAIAFINSIA